MVLNRCVALHILPERVLSQIYGLQVAVVAHRDPHTKVIWQPLVFPLRLVVDVVTDAVLKGLAELRVHDFEVAKLLSVKIEIPISIVGSLFIERRVACVNCLFGLIECLEAVKQVVLLPEALSGEVVTIIFVDQLLQGCNILVSDANLGVSTTIVASLVC